MLFQCGMTLKLWMNFFPTFLVLALSLSRNHIHRENQQIPFSTTVSHRGDEGSEKRVWKKRPENKKRTTRHTTMWKWRKIDKIHVEWKTKRSWATETSVCLGGMGEQACILYFDSVWKINKWKFVEKICIESALVWSGSLLLLLFFFLVGKIHPYAIVWVKEKKKCVTRKWIIFID